MARKKPPPPGKPEEALAWFAAQIPYTRKERDALDAETRKQAFFVSNVAQVRVVADVHAAISKAIAKGETLETFKKRAAAKLEAEWGGEIPGRLETIFRNGVQSAYNAGRLEIFEDPVVKQLRPYRAWSVILDKRTTEFICKPLAKVVVLADSSFARTHIPPNHHRCRSGIMSLSAEDVAAEGGATQPHHLPDAPPAEGFGGDPRRQPEPALGELPAPLKRILASKLRAGPAQAQPELPSSAAEPTKQEATPRPPRPARAAASTPATKAPAAKAAAPKPAKALAPSTVYDAARGLLGTEASFGRSVFISEVAKALGVPLEDFKRDVIIPMWSSGELYVVRQDVLDFLTDRQLEMVRESETHRGGARVHAVKLKEEDAPGELYFQRK